MSTARVSARPPIGSIQCGLDCGAEVGVGETRPVQQEPGGDALEKQIALVDRQAAGGRHDNLQLGVIQGEHDFPSRRIAGISQSLRRWGSPKPLNSVPDTMTVKSV